MTRQTKAFLIAAVVVIAVFIGAVTVVVTKWVEQRDATDRRLTQLAEDNRRIGEDNAELLSIVKGVIDPHGEFAMRSAEAQRARLVILNCMALYVSHQTVPECQDDVARALELIRTAPPPP